MKTTLETTSAPSGLLPSGIESLNEGDIVVIFTTKPLMFIGRFAFFEEEWSRIGLTKPMRVITKQIQVSPTQFEVQASLGDALPTLEAFAMNKVLSWPLCDLVTIAPLKDEQLRNAYTEQTSGLVLPGPGANGPKHDGTMRRGFQP